MSITSSNWDVCPRCGKPFDWEVLKTYADGFRCPSCNTALLEFNRSPTLDEALAATNAEIERQKKLQSKNAG